MKTTEVSPNMLDQKLTEAHQIIDEFVLQMALGKAEASDKFDELKKEFRSKLSVWKADFANTKILESLKSIFEDRKSLTLSEKIDEILEGVHTFEQEVKKEKSPKPAYILYDLQILKLKLEIIRLRISVKKFELTAGFRNKMSEAKQLIEKTGKIVSKEISQGKKKLNDFSDEAYLVFDHLKKAVRSIR